MRKVRLIKADYLYLRHVEPKGDDGALVCKNDDGGSGDGPKLCGDFCPFFELCAINSKPFVKLWCVNSLDPLLLEVVEEPEV